MRLSNSAHTARHWRIQEIAPDFELEDVWELPTPGEPGDFPRLVRVVTSLDPSQGSSRAVRALFAIRWKIGGLLGWDDSATGLGSRVPTLQDRLPEDLRDSGMKDIEALPFTPLYLTDDEYAAEIANQTVHGIVHLGWVPDEDGRYRAQMAVYVKPNGRFGKLYMAAIGPFRHLIVYPALMREIGKAWSARGGEPAADRWVVLYDSDCGFCKWLLAGLLRWDRAGRLRPVPLQGSEADELLADLAPAERTASWHLVPDGQAAADGYSAPGDTRRSGGAAAPPLLRLLPGGRLPAALFARLPGLTDRGYRWVAAHRSQLSRWVPARSKRRAGERVREREEAIAARR